MRAVLIRGFSPKEDSVELIGDDAHHLVKVVRVKIGEDVLILNGKGESFKSRVSSLTKKSAKLQIESSMAHNRKCLVDLALCPPKKDALADIVKYSVELGIKSIIPVKSNFSQGTLKNDERTARLVESAMIQSNNPFLLEICDEMEFSNLDNLFESYDYVFYFSSISSNSFSPCKGLLPESKILVVIGPEGGLSKEEELQLTSQEKVEVFQFNSWILRSQTAVATALGFIFNLMR